MHQYFVKKTKLARQCGQRQLLVEGIWPSHNLQPVTGYKLRDTGTTGSKHGPLQNQSWHHPVAMAYATEDF
jgi:hypothetical protein